MSVPAAIRRDSHGWRSWWRKFREKFFDNHENDEDDQLPPGPQNTLTVRSLSHFHPNLRKTQPAKSHRIPTSLGNHHWSVAHWTNCIKTSQYEYWSFFFINLFQQCIIPVNFYFLVMACLQMVGDISDSNRLPTYLVPIAFVFLVTMLKDAWEDVKRHRSDREENHRKTKILDNDGQWVDAYWSQIEPGDIVLVQADEVFPADLIMITCSDEFGAVYLNTVQLDGETNMKTKTAIPTLHERFKDDMACLARSKLEVIYGPPSARLYSFQCLVRVYDEHYDFDRANSVLKASMSRSRSIFGERSKEASIHSAVRADSMTRSIGGKHDSMHSFVSRRSQGNFDDADGYSNSNSNNNNINTVPAIGRGASPTTAPSVGPPYVSHTVGGVPLKLSSVSFKRGSLSLLESREGPRLEFSCNIHQFLWRGATLVNTSWVCGIAAYTGHSTRIFKNTRRRRLKYSGLLKSYNYCAMSLFVLQICFCIIIGIVYMIDVKTNQSKANYLMPEDSIEFSGTFKGSCVAFGRAFGRYILLLSYFIPITLLIQLEICRWFHRYYIVSDRFSFSTVTGTYPTVSTLSILEDLGCVTHVFSDKTGTLTQNIMQLKAFAVNGKVFGISYGGDDNSNSSHDNNKDKEDDSLLPEIIKRKRQGLVDVADCEENPINSEIDYLLRQMDCWTSMEKSQDKSQDKKNPTKPDWKEIADDTMNSPNRYVKFNASLARRKLLHEDKDTRAKARAFLLILSVCHSVLPKTTNVVTRVIEAEDVSPTITAAVSSVSDDTGVRNMSDAVNQNIEASPFSPDNTDNRSYDGFKPTPDSVIRSYGPAVDPDYTELKQSKFQTFVTALSSKERDGSTERTPRSTQTGDLDMRPELEMRPAQQQDEGLLSNHPPPPSTSGAAAIQHVPNTAHLREQQFRAADGDTHAASQQEDDVHAQQPSPDTAREIAGYERMDTPPLAAAKRDREVRREVKRSLRKDRQHMSAIPSASHCPSPADNNLVEIAAVEWNRNLDAMYDASSPDELALVAGAKHLGIEFLRRPDLNTVEVGILTTNAEKLFLDPADREWIKKKKLESGNPALIPTLSFSLLEVLDFDNFRKRMSVIIRDRDGLLKLLTKGADSSMLNIAAANQEDVKAEMSNCLADFAREGLRTLVFGFRVISDDEYTVFATKLTNLRASGNDDVELYSECYSMIEKDITLVACSAIDDKLQDDVPKTIEALKDAGVRVWVLTGDKVETAIAIGHSCNLLTDTTYNAIIDGKTAEEVQNQMYEYMAFVVGGQLAKDAFDQIIAQQNTVLETSSTYLMGQDTLSPEQRASKGNSTENSLVEDSAWRTCIARTARGLTCGAGRQEGDRKRKRQGNSRITAVMGVEEFVNILTFNARFKKVVAPVDGHSSPKHLNQEEIERLIEVYLQGFQPPAEKKGGTLSRLGDLVTVKKPAVPTSAASSMAESPPKSGPKSDKKLLCPPPVQPGLPLPGSAALMSEQTLSDSSKRGRNDVEQYTAVAITIAGDALNLALATDTSRKYFFGLAHLSSTVIACRVTPRQKAEVVRQCGRCTPTSSFKSLGIGDGANDVGMILTANIGVGILGKEGSQAARSSDIAIGEFKVLKNLLFTHGHMILKRHAIMMYLTIFKNIIFAMTEYLCAFFTSYSAADPFNPFMKQLYNLVLTPWPTMSIATFDRHLPYDVLLNCAALYPIASDPNGTQYYGVRKFLAWLAYSMMCSVVIVFVPFGMLKSATTLHTVIDWPSFGNLLFFLTVLVSICVTIPFTHTMFWFTPIAFLLSICSFYILWTIFSFMDGNLRGGIYILSHGMVHSMILLPLFIAIAPIFIRWKYQTIFNPDPAAVIRERIKKGVFDIVVGPRRHGESAVVVPRTHQKEVWKGFAFANAETRFSLQRRNASSCAPYDGSFTQFNENNPKHLDLHGIDESDEVQSITE